MRPHRNLAVVHAAELFAASIVELVDKTPAFLHKPQILKASQSVNANIGEGFGRVTLKERNNKLAIARGETEEAMRHLRANFVANRITARDYWPRHNRGVTIVKMLNGLMR